MRKGPELVVTPNDVQAIEPLIEAGANAFIIGEMNYGLRLAGEFSRSDIVEATAIAHEHGAKVYVAMNAIFHNEKIAELYDYMTFLVETNVDAVIFGDPAVLMVAKEVAPNMKLHWNPETTATNWYTANYWGRKGAARAVLAREINLDQIVEIKEHADVEIEIQIHGMTCMFQSKRKLVGNYFQYQGKNLAIETTDRSRNMFLHDPDRNAKYPIFEDVNGTHIMSANDMCMIDELGELLDARIDAFRFDGIFKTTAYLKEVVSSYKEAIELYFHDEEAYEDEATHFLQRLEAIQPPNRKLDTGFFFKETVY